MPRRFSFRRLPPRGCAHRVSRLVMHNCSSANLKARCTVGRVTPVRDRCDCEQIGRAEDCPPYHSRLRSATRHCRTFARSYRAQHRWTEPKPRKTSRNCERKSASTTGYITRTPRLSSATANTTGFTRSLLISKRNFLISSRPIRQLNASAENRCRRLRKSSTARRCSASTTPIPKKKWRIFTNGSRACCRTKKSPSSSSQKWMALRCR